jgi:hypothetical protein
MQKLVDGMSVLVRPITMAPDLAVVLSLAREHCHLNSSMVTLLPDLCGIPIISYQRRGGMEILMAIRAWYRVMVLK